MKHSCSPIDTLVGEIEALGLEITRPSIERCLDYWELLCSAAPKINVISDNAVSEGPVRHIGDSLAALVQWLPAGTIRLLDVGTGGGLPGIPLTLAHPGLQTVLLEAQDRKAHWLASTVHKLGLGSRVTVIHGRIESQAGEEVRAFNTVTARAVAAPGRLFKWVLPALGDTSQLLLWHSDQQTDEIVQALKKVYAGRGFGLYNTLSYEFGSICYSSNISSICEAH